MTDFNDLTKLIEEAGSVGMLQNVMRKPTTDEILCGYLGTKDERFAIRQLISLHADQKSKQKFKVGNKVRVRKEYVHLGFNRGWDGYAPMFADEVGTVIAVEWSPTNSAWSVLVEYENSYRYVSYRAGEFYVQNTPSSFMFWPEYLKKV